MSNLMHHNLNEHLRFWLLVSIMFVVGVLLINETPIHHIPYIERVGHHFLEKLGDALVIAALLAYPVDQYLKSRLLREVSRDVLSFTAGHDVPGEMKNVITDILRRPYARRHFRIRFSLHPVTFPGPLSCVRLEMLTSYEVHNLTHQMIPYTLQSAIEKSYLSQHEPSTIRAVRTATFQLNQEEIRSADGYREDDTHVRFSKPMELAPVGKTPLTVSTERTSVYPESYFYILDVLDLTLGATVEVVDSPGFCWNVMFAVPGSPSQSRNTWSHPGAHLPGQFIRIMWTKIQ